MEYSNEYLKETLRELRLYYASDNLDSIMRTLEEKSPREMLSHLVAVETLERKNRSINRRLAEARLGRFKLMGEFDWAHPEKMNRPKVEHLLKSDLNELGKNIIIIGTQGLGKTMLARNLGYQAIHQGKKVRFTTASKLVADLIAAGHRLESRLRYYTNFDLLIIDELGYLSYQDKAADMLFEVVSRRYEKAPIILTTNLMFKEWPKVFPGAACVSAILDRLIHHCEIIEITGSSYRKRDSKNAGK